MDLILSNLVPIAVLAVIATLFIVMMTVLKNTHVTPPNQVAVISGSKRNIGEEGAKVGYRIVTGGRFFLMPVLEKVDFVSLNLMTFPVAVTNVPSKSGAMVSVQAVANVKVLSDHSMLGLAIERFLGKTPEQIQNIAKENLESNLRSIVGKMEIEELLKERDKLQTAVLGEAVSDLGKMGLGVDLLNIQSVDDQGGYIKALGESRTAEVKRDASIGKAKAEQQSAMEVQAARAKGEQAKLEADMAISNQTRATQLAIAENDAQVQAAQAKVPLIAQTVAAGEQSKLNLQVLEKARKERELEATVVVTAEKTAQANVIEAEGQARAAEQLGQAEKIKQTRFAEGQLAATRAAAEGRIAQAEAAQREQEAQAAGSKAQGLAKAAVQQAELLAHAEGTRATLLAEAEGIEKKAEAMAKLDEAGRFLMILDASPKAIHALGQAFAAALTPTAQAIGQGLGNIDKIQLTQLGSSADQGNIVQQFAAVPVETIATIVEKARALGFSDVANDLLKKAGLDPEKMK
jgi:flotillin